MRARARRRCPSTLAGLVARYATLPEQTAVLQGDWRLFRVRGVAGGVPYHARFRVALCPGDPLCAAEDTEALLSAFLAACRRAHWQALFAPASARFATLARGCGGSAWKIGEEPSIDLEAWTLAGRAKAPLRAALNHARRAGVCVDEWTPNDGDDAELRAVWQRWRAARRTPPLGFVLAGEPLQPREGRRWFVARRDGAVQGFVVTAALPAREAVAIEHFVRMPNATRGSVETLVVEAFRAHQARGVRYGTLGVAPFRGLASEPASAGGSWKQRLAGGAMLALWMRAAGLYRTSTLDRFKRKFPPTWWEPVYAVHVPALVTPRLGAGMALELLPGGPAAWTQWAVRAAAERLRGWACREGVRL